MSWRILCYHEVPRRTTASFRRQLIWLMRRGARFCSLARGIEHAGEPGARVTVTFDDGDATVFEHALPVLRDLSIPACLYAATACIGNARSYEGCLPRPAMTWHQMRAWVEAGNEAGSHTHTHARLTRCTREEAAEQIVRSCERLRSELGIVAQHFAYPWGQHTPGLNGFVAELGRFASLATIVRGPNDQPMDAPVLLRRDVVEPDWSPLRLTAVLAWGSSAAYAVHRSRRGPSPEPLPCWLAPEVTR